jgi:PAS domain S-box-containing protein
VIELSQYIFEALRTDEELILYRGLSRDDGSAVLMLSPVLEYASPETLKRLEHEFSLREELDRKWFALPIGITRHLGRTVLVLEDPGGAPLDHVLGRPVDIEFALGIAIGLASAIDQLHQRGIIHKDIKPANVLVEVATGECWLTGLGLASRLPRERQRPSEPPEFIAGTLAYMAPEQTGRMNRSVDSRSDLYSLGVTLYQMFTGALPFTASDPMEWVHCHVARQPITPRERRPGLPAILSAVIMKLLAKTAEERYQTAAGVASDLRRCLSEWNTHRHIEPFTIGEQDVSDRVLIPEKLYGRAKEIDALLASFDRVVASGRPELVLVSGYSGIGKSSVVNELHKVLVPPRGLFAWGKFDQYKRDIPYATLAQAFDSLIRPLLSKSEAEFNYWCDVLREALGPNGQLMVDLVPELELLVGKQVPLPDLPPQDAQRRFQLVVRRFISVFARLEHPVTLFLDDLQWLDAATLNLLEDLLIKPNVRHLMLIGAYRDNEVSPTHPLMGKLETIREAGASVHHIVLAPLGSADVEMLLADSLHSQVARVAPLAQLVHEKTAGNPFFAVQFIQTLAEEGLLTFDHGDRVWSWDLNRIRAIGYTDNVVDLMVGKLNRLPIRTQQALAEFACLGNSAEVATLSLVHGRVLRSPAKPDEGVTSDEEVHAELWEAARLELIVRFGGSYKFVHDRVQEAVYSLIPEESRAGVHLRIGRLLATHIAAENREEAIFEIVNQINRGATLITSGEEREQLAQFNLIAGKRARNAAAHAAALKYFAAGGALLSEDRWERGCPLIFALNLAHAECEYLSGNTSAAKKRLETLSRRAATLVDCAAATCLQIELYTNSDQADRAIKVALDFLESAGTSWSPHPSDLDVSQEFEQIWRQLGERSIEQLIDLPPLADPVCSALLDVLTAAHAPAHFTDVNLLALIIARMVNLSIGHGNGDGSPLGYVYLGIILESRFGDYKAGFRLGKLGVDLVERAGLDRFKAHAYLNFGNAINPWTRHVRTSLDLLQTALSAANRSGHLTFAAYSYTNLIAAHLFTGDLLPDVQRFADSALAFVQQTGFGTGVDLILGHLGLIRALRGLTPDLSKFNHATFDEIRFEQHIADDPALGMSACWYWIRKLQACFLAGDLVSALSAALKAESLLWTCPGFLVVADFHFYAGLTRASHYGALSNEKISEHSLPSLSGVQFGGETSPLLQPSNTPSPLPPGTQQSQEHGAPSELLEKLTAHQKQFKAWAETCAENFQNRYLLLSAEMARTQGRPLDAEGLYQEAIHSAHANGFIQNESLARELAARFYAERGLEDIAQLYLRKARYGYLRWGATGKVRQLDELYPELRDREEEPTPTATSTIGKSVEHLDLATVIKVSQSVSGEIFFEKLIDTLMRTAIEHAGAQRGVLILHRGADQRIEAEAITSGEAISVGLGEKATATADVPESIVNYVVRTRETVMLDDAATENPFSTDPYIRRHRARSILCLPLINQGKLSGALYLENNLAPHVFSSAKTAVLKLVASQAATSFEITRLYGDLEEREAKIRRLVESNIIGIFIWNLEGQIIEANEAFLHMVNHTSEDLVAGRLNWKDLTPPEWYDITQRGAVQLKATGILEPYEKEYFRNDGSRVSVLVGSAVFEKGQNEGVAFVLDLTEQKQAEEALQKAQAELAHVTRVLTVGELTASIAHEVNQPLAAIVTNGNAGLRWLNADSPNLEETNLAIRRIIRDAMRASEIVSRVQALFKKAPAVQEPVEINEIIDEVLLILHPEINRHQVSLQTQLVSNLPIVFGDRIQLQQVILNLILNAIQAMSSVAEGPRRLEVISEAFYRRSGSNLGENQDDGMGGISSTTVLVTVRDSGPGLDPQSIDRLFDAFYTTKPQGLGMGLAISRSIIEAHAGRLWAKPNAPLGAVFQFTVPAKV